MKRLLATTALALLTAVPLMAAEPITDTVTVGDTQWAQPDLFTGISGVEITRVCPGGNCDAGTGSALAGRDMSGWTWASRDDVRAMLATLAPEVAQAPELTTENSTWAPAFFDTLGFRPTLNSEAGRGMLGRTSTSTDLYRDVTVALSDFTGPGLEDALTLEYWTPHHYPYATTGAFFYRDTPAAE